MYDIGIQEASKAGKEGSAEILSHKKSGHAYYIRMGFNLNSGQTGLSFSLRGCPQQVTFARIVSLFVSKCSRNSLLEEVHGP